MKRRTATMPSFAAAASSLLLLANTPAASTASSSSPQRPRVAGGGGVLRNEDLYDIMMIQSRDKSNRRHLSTVSAEEKSRRVSQNWISISPDTQFLPNLDIETLRSLASSSSNHKSGSYSASDPYSTEFFVDGMAEYDELAQAWRKLGYMIDCNTNDEDMYSQHSHHSQDEEQQVTESTCGRYLIWGAYVDESYSGGGFSEYQYYNPDNAAWDSSACSNGGRCQKLDCHSSDTSFSILGFFKHKKYDDFNEQLFKHAGICTWSDEQYSFMKNARKGWPQGCTSSGSTLSSGAPLYFDLKPEIGGDITIAMYTDSDCTVEYSMSTSKIEQIIGNIFTEQHSGDHGNNNNNGGGYDFSGDSLEDSLNRWNSYYDWWSICNHCVAHDLENSDGSKYSDVCSDDDDANNDDDKAGYYQNWNNVYGGNRKLGGESCPTGAKFECYDDAGYTNVNQCMKFSAKTVMRSATFKDLAKANLQGSLTTNPLSGYVNQSFEFTSKTRTNALTYGFLVSMILLLLGSFWYLVQIIREARRSRKNSDFLKETLV